MAHYQTATLEGRNQDTGRGSKKKAKAAASKTLSLEESEMVLQQIDAELNRRRANFQKIVF